VSPYTLYDIANKDNSTHAMGLQYRNAYLQVCDVAARMSGAISHAVRDLTKEGVLPEARYSAPAVREVSSKQRRLLGPSAVLTSAVAFPIAAAARRASGALFIDIAHDQNH
jgi:hypothetical protein